MDGAKKTLTLEGGTKLTFSEQFIATPVAFKKGTMITAICEERGRQKVVTAVEEQPP